MRRRPAFFIPSIPSSQPCSAKEREKDDDGGQRRLFNTGMQHLMPHTSEPVFRVMDSDLLTRITFPAPTFSRSSLSLFWLESNI